VNPQGRVWFLPGLFLATLATLALEILNTRLLSVLTWYHLSFFAVSMAMFGMSAGAVQVYLGGERYAGDRAPRALARCSALFALSVPLCHVLNLVIPIQAEVSATGIAALAATTVAMAVPFHLSGMVVAIALTRIPRPSGLVYAVDLVGAAVGCLFVLPLLRHADISSAVLVLGAVAAAASVCFHAFAGAGGARRLAALAALLLVLGGVNAATPHGLRVLYYKGKPRPSIQAEYWTIHGQVIVGGSGEGRPFYWGAGRGAEDYRVHQTQILIDGGAGTVMTRWDGRHDSLSWTAHDVSALPYHLRPGGLVAVIGAGGGRDVLTALWAGSRRVTAIEINEAILRILERSHREYVNLARLPRVDLVNDEARSYLTRTDERYDIIQMSLIDTWAATGAGAFTLSENGLYTVEAWKVFLGRLAPGGLLSVSRWYAPEAASETSRLVSLAAATLLELGAERPEEHMALVSRNRVATLILSPRPLTSEDVDRIEAVSEVMGFTVLLLPGRPGAQDLLHRIAASRSREAMDRTLEGLAYDYSPPTDERPYFFNVLRPGSLFRETVSQARPGVVATGNLAATKTLILLLCLAVILVTAAILGPLAVSGRPSLDGRSFFQAVLYFSAIGAGFMLVQIPLMQRFSVYLGHPAYAVVVVLFSMILAAGIGSFLSDRCRVERRPAWLVAVPLAIAAMLLALTFGLQSVIDATIAGGLLPRCLVVVALVACVSVPMGCCFPFGLRIVRRIADDATPWMWGVNGACGVLAAITATAVSLWYGIHANLMLAAAAYALVAAPAAALWRKGNLQH